MSISDRWACIRVHILFPSVILIGFRESLDLEHIVEHTTIGVRSSSLYLSSFLSFWPLPRYVNRWHPRVIGDINKMYMPALGGRALVVEVTDDNDLKTSMKKPLHWEREREVLDRLLPVRHMFVEFLPLIKKK